MYVHACNCVVHKSYVCITVSQYVCIIVYVCMYMCMYVCLCMWQHVFVLHFAHTIGGMYTLTDIKFCSCKYSENLFSTIYSTIMVYTCVYKHITYVGI